MATKTKKRKQHKRSRVSPPPRKAAAHARPVVASTSRSGPSGARRVLNAPPPRLYAYALGVAVLVGTLLIGLSLISAHRSTGGSVLQTSTSGTTGVAGAAETAALLNGIPQHGNVLGSSQAPVRLIEYADPQCPFCAMYTLNVMPALIRDYVRSGKVQLVFRGVWFLGRDSGTALATATAAGRESRFWNVMELLYRNQGAENSGWVTDSLLRSIVTAAGADANRVFAERSSTAVVSTINGWSALARNEGVNGVPSFFYGRRGGPLNRLTPSAIAVPEFRAALDQALK